MKVASGYAQTIQQVRERKSHRSRSVALSLLVWEGTHANVFIVLTGGAFLTGMAIFLGANDFELGVLAAVPFLMQSAQLLSPFVFRNPLASKERVALTLALSRLLWLAVIPLLLLNGTWRLHMLIGIVLLSGLLTMVSSPAWLSWMAEVVPGSVRGRFFSRRNAAVAVTTLAGTILGSLILDWSRIQGSEAMGFVSILLLGTIGALLAWRTMNKIPDGIAGIPTYNRRKHDFLAPFQDRGFRRVLIVFAFWNISVGLPAAFFAPHMLLNLKMSFFQIGLYTCTTALITVLSSRVWGGLIDRFGSKPVLNVCAFGIGLIPMIWLFLQENLLWILVPEAIYSGFLWAGFNLAAFTLPLDRSSKANRNVYLSVFATVTGLAFFVSSIMAGYVAESLSGWSCTLGGLTIINYHVLFVGSGVLRLLTAGLLASFREPAEMRLPVVIQLMGYAVLKRMSLGRQLFPLAAETASSSNKQRNALTTK